MFRLRTWRRLQAHLRAVAEAEHAEPPPPDAEMRRAVAHAWECLRDCVRVGCTEMWTEFIEALQDNSAADLAAPRPLAAILNVKVRLEDVYPLLDRASAPFDDLKVFLTRLEDVDRERNVTTYVRKLALS